MTLSEIITGFEQVLELERELGVRSVECDRSLLATAAKSAAAQERREAATAAAKEEVTLTEQNNKQVELPVVFLHHAALSAGGVEMMAKIVTALKLSAEESPIIFTGELPAAKQYIVLGGKALAQWFPAVHSAPGNSFEREGHKVYVTYSPEYILKFKIVTPAVKQLKLEMWNGIKSRCRGV